jgi:glutamate racemase
MHNHLLNNKPSYSLPIGIMDSGVGGISVLHHVRKRLPNESIYYVADSLYAPYGNKSATEITERCFAISNFLIAKGVKALVVACNTATAASIQAMREQYDLPIIGMEPAVKPAVNASRNGVIGVLATVGTIKSAQYAALLANYGTGVTVLAQACVGLVECVERGALATASTRQLLARYLQPLLDNNADTIVLGCTHYPFLRPLIEEIVGSDIAVIDTGDAVSLQLQKKLAEKKLLVQNNHDAEVVFWTNSQLATAVTVMQTLYGHPVNIQQLTI